MRNHLQVIHDIRCLEEHVRGDYLQHVVHVLSSCSSDVLESVRQSILQSGQSLKSLEPLVVKAVVESLVEKSVEVGCILQCLFIKLVVLFRCGDEYLCNFLDFIFLPLLPPIPFQFVYFFACSKIIQDLRQMKGITATYRMTNKPLPVRHSPYVTGVLRPLKVCDIDQVFMVYIIFTLIISFRSQLDLNTMEQ